MFLYNSPHHHQNSIAHGNYMGNKFVQWIKTSTTNTVKHQKTVHHIRKNIDTYNKNTVKMYRQSITVVQTTA